MPHSHHYILANLNVRAVLPAMRDLAHFSGEVREWIDGSDFALTVGVFSDVETILHFHDSQVETILDVQGPHLALRCPTHRQINHLFEDRGYYFPIITGNYLLLPKLLLFSKIAKQLERYLRPDATELKDPAFFKQHVSMLFHVLIRSIAIVGELDEQAAHIAKGLPEGTAVFELDDCSAKGWVQVDHKSIRSGTGEPPSPPDVVVQFASAEIFYNAASDKIDSLAAVGAGDIRVKGLVPLADGLSLVMERIGLYLSN